MIYVSYRAKIFKICSRYASRISAKHIPREHVYFYFILLTDSSIAPSTVRSCGPKTAKGCRQIWEHRVASKDPWIIACYCTTDLCNIGRTLLSSSAVLATCALAATFLRRYWRTTIYVQFFTGNRATIGHVTLAAEHAAKYGKLQERCQQTDSWLYISIHPMSANRRSRGKELLR